MERFVGGRTDGVVLPKKSNLKIESIPPWAKHQALEFFKPGEDDGQLGGRQFLLAHFDHQAALTVRCNVKRAKIRG